MHMKIEILLANDCADSGRQDADADADDNHYHMWMVEKGSELGLEVFAFLGFLCLSSVRWLCSESKALGNIMKAAIEVAVESRASSLVLATAANYHNPYQRLHLAA